MGILITLIAGDLNFATKLFLSSTLTIFQREHNVSVCTAPIANYAHRKCIISLTNPYCPSLEPASEVQKIDILSTQRLDAIHWTVRRVSTMWRRMPGRMSWRTSGRRSGKVRRVSGRKLAQVGLERRCWCSSVPECGIDSVRIVQHLLQTPDVVNRGFERVHLAGLLLSYRFRNVIPKPGEGLVHQADAVAFSLVAPCHWLRLRLGQRVTESGEVDATFAAKQILRGRRLRIEPLASPTAGRDRCWLRRRSGAWIKRHRQDEAGRYYAWKQTHIGGQRRCCCCIRWLQRCRNGQNAERIHVYGRLVDGWSMCRWMVDGSCHACVAIGTRPSRSVPVTQLARAGRRRSRSRLGYRLAPLRRHNTNRRLHPQKRVARACVNQWALEWTRP